MVTMMAGNSALDIASVWSSSIHVPDSVYSRIEEPLPYPPRIYPLVPSTIELPPQIDLGRELPEKAENGVFVAFA